MTEFKKIRHSRDELIAKARAAMEGHSSIVFAYLFGSQARGAPSPHSDIDIAVFVDTNDLADEKLAIIGDLINRLGTDEIDLVILNTAPLPLRARVLRKKEILIDRKPHRRHLFESLVLREYFDFSIKEDAISKRRYSLG